MASKKGTHKSLAQNRKARHDYFVEQAIEAGLCLHGTEVKSIRMGKVNLKESYAAFEADGLYVVGMHISPYEKGNVYNTEPLRKKKLLLHKSELFRLRIQVQQKGLTLIPLNLYLKEGLVKLELGVCRGKKLYDKRADAAERDTKRETDRALRGEKY